MYKTIRAAFKANEAFQKWMRESGVRDHVPTKIVTLKYAWATVSMLIQACTLFQEGEKSGQG